MARLSLAQTSNKTAYTYKQWLEIDMSTIQQCIYIVHECIYIIDKRNATHFAFNGECIRMSTIVYAFRVYRHDVKSTHVNEIQPLWSTISVSRWNWIVRGRFYYLKGDYKWNYCAICDFLKICPLIYREI